MSDLIQDKIVWPSYLDYYIKKGATDIHVNWGRVNRCMVRYQGRCEHVHVPITDHQRWCRQVFWHCGFARYERHVFTHQSTLIANEQVRVCYAPTIQGMHMVIRLHQELPEMRRYDFMDVWQGGMLIAGLTGSGKTTLAYQWLKHLANNLAVVTLEDPPEMLCEQLVQMVVHPSHASKEILKSVLRHDPDVIFVGELRDRQGVDLFRNWLLTGHMVMSTIHAGCAQTALKRLHFLGFPKTDNYLLSGIVAMEEQTYQPVMHTLND